MSGGQTAGKPTHWTRKWTVAAVALMVFAGVVPAAAAGGTALGEDLQQLSYGETATSFIGTDDLSTTDDPLGQDRSGTWYYESVTFDGERGDTVTIDMSTGVNAVLVLVDPSGDVVAVNDNCDSETLDACITRELESTGQYEIRTTFYKSENTHSYTLSIDRVDTVERQPTEHPRFEVVDATVNETDVYAGDGIEVTATVRNEGTAAGNYAGILTVNDRRLGTEYATLAPGEQRNLTYTATLTNLGQSRLFLRSDHLLDVQVHQRPDEPVVNSTTENGTTTAAVRFADGPITLSLGAPASNGVSFERLALDAPASDFDLTATPTETDGMADSLPDGVEPLGALSIDGTPALRNLTLTVGVNGTLPTDRLTVYRTDNGTNWTTHDLDVVSAADGETRMQVRAPGASTFVVALTNPVFETGSPSLSTTEVTEGESVSVTTQVSNVGAAAGSHTVSLTVDGSVAAEQTVDLAAGETTTVTLTATPSAGSHALAVDGSSAGEVSVSAAATETTTEAPSEDGDDADEEDAGDAGTTPGAGPGFGTLGALLALVALAVLATRRGRTH